MQSKLDQFFKFTTKYSQTNKKCFIYDPDHTKASFVTNPDDNDIFVDTKCNIKLFYKPSQTIITNNIPNIETNISVPILKSNLQKAIRRHENNIALTTTLALIKKDPIELLRRLPIIYIEDVCLLDSYPIIVWLMMADKQYKLTNYDIILILEIVNHLCNVHSYYDDNINHKCDRHSFELSHTSLQNFDHRDCLLALFYRSQYGGMKGDMLMLRNSIYYYSDNPSEIQETCYNFTDLHNISSSVQILNEAIDFHPLPHLLVQIKNKIDSDTNINEQDIKMCIWFSESGVNMRKRNTIQKSEEMQKTQLWKLIKPNLDFLRKRIMMEYA